MGLTKDLGVIVFELFFVNQFTKATHCKLLDEYEIIVYTFYYKDGFRIDLYLTEDSPTNNMVDIEYVEQEKTITFNKNFYNYHSI